MKPLAILWFAVLASVAVSASAQQVDPHRIYEENCAKCHADHAGDFAWEALTDSDGRLFGRVSGRPVHDMLEQGHGGLTMPETDTLLDQFSLIRQSGRLFRKKCRICHDSAVRLARLDLILNGDRLEGRYTGRDIAEFLHRHGRLDGAEIATMMEILVRALESRTNGG